jgi:hypothetical protein
MPLLTNMPRRVLLLRRLRMARAERIGKALDAAERERAMRRLLDQAATSAERS